jgi:CxxC motif-containing protein (DUF1111 family)
MLGLLGLCVVAGLVIGGSRRVEADSKAAKPDPVAQGYEIFNREWMPNDPRGHGGDGLGPSYNDTSCVACHNSGGSGGAGPVSKNIDIMHASRNGQPVQQAQPGQNPESVLDPLLAIHPGFQASKTVVLHKFGIDPNYDAWRQRALHPGGQRANPGLAGVVAFDSIQTGDVAVINGAVATNFPVQATVSAQAASEGALNRLQQVRQAAFANIPSAGELTMAGPFLITRSQRNPTPLFGLGLIDSIPEAAIEAMAARQAKETPEIQGRPSRLKSGKIGRLGWKGQTADAEEFVLNACAVEVGLEVPGHHQALVATAPKYKPPGLDLTAEECAALVAYVRSLPKPVERDASGAEAEYLASGRVTFASIGCAGCHAAKVGDVEEIYSDLLLHDMGSEMADSGSYGDGGEGGDDEPLDPLSVAGNVNGGQGKAIRGALRQEWRTPPLWGFRDSGPYLHDGRAQTLDQAISMHGGQGAASAQRFFELSPKERLQVEAFLKSLVAPPAPQLARAGD